MFLVNQTELMAISKLDGYKLMMLGVEIRGMEGHSPLGSVLHNSLVFLLGL
jgi:hypothetical protein